MADTLILVKQSIDKKICLSEKINCLIDKFDAVRKEPKPDFSPSKS